MSTCLEADKNQFVAQMGPVAGMLGRLAADSNPEMKQNVATFSGTLCEELPQSAGMHMKNVVVGLTANLQHQHSKVRKTTLRGLKNVIVARGAEGFLSDSVPQLKMTMNDRS